MNGSGTAASEQTNRSADEHEEGQELSYKVNGNGGSVKGLSEDGSNNNDLDSIPCA